MTVGILTLLECLPTLWEGLLNTPGHLGGPPDNSGPFRMAFRSLPALREVLLTFWEGLQTNHRPLLGLLTTPGPP